MDTLHLSYHEVVDVIPYRNLVIMQKDKLHTVHTDLMEEVDEAAFFRSKGKKNPIKKK